MKYKGITHKLGMPEYIPISSTHWKLGSDYWTRIYTDAGIFHCEMAKGWITDKRSGSSIVDAIIPKSWNADYDAVILSHDLIYSGWLSRDAADELLRDGLIWSGISKWRANLAYAGVRIGGASAWRELSLPLDDPYLYNRDLERFTWDDKK
jgi:hypothetical protein